MTKFEPSQMSMKGWHHDISDAIVEKSQDILSTLNKTNRDIYYTEHPNKYLFGIREFWLCPSEIEQTKPRKIVVATFDIWGNLVIYPDFLLSGGIDHCNTSQETA